MKNTLIFLMMSFLFFACQDEERKVPTDLIPSVNQKSEDMAKITFEEEVYDFGKIIEGEKTTFTYHFKNTGKSDLVISDVNPECGCTTAKNWSKKPYRPGEEGNITITFESEGRPGPTHKRITVITNAFPAVTDLKFEGEVIGPDKK